MAGSTLSVTSSLNSSLEAIVQQYMTLQRRPLQNLESQKNSINTRISLLDDFKSRLSQLQDVAQDFLETEGQTPFNPVQVTSSDSDAISVTAGSDATEGIYNIRVRQLATPTTVRSTAGLNTAPSVKSKFQVVAGFDTLETSEDWEDAGFGTTPTGTVSFNTGNGWVTFTLSDYSSVDDFMDAVNDDATAGVNIYYDESSDKFVIEKDSSGGTLSVKQSVSTGFLAQAKIADASTGDVIEDTAEHSFTSNDSGVQTDTYLYQANFDNGLSSTDSGSFKINEIEISWDADEDTLEDIISRINSSEADVTAFYDESLDKVVITANETGNSEIQLEDVTGTFLTSTLKFSGATQSLGNNALFTINSTDSADEMSQTSNSFSINGLTFTLNEVTVANDSYSDSSTQAVTITAEKDIDAMVDEIENFLEKYNNVVDYLGEKLEVDTVTYSRSDFAGESIIMSLRSSLIDMALEEVSGLDSGDPATLSEIGITFDSNLRLTISDSTTLRNYLSEDVNKVANIFRSTNGIANQIDDLLDLYTEDYTGLIDEQTEILLDQIDSIDRRIDRLEVRLSIKEANYRQQLVALQSLYLQVARQQAIMNSILSIAQNVSSS